MTEGGAFLRLSWTSLTDEMCLKKRLWMNATIGVTSGLEDLPGQNKNLHLGMETKWEPETVVR